MSDLNWVRSLEVAWAHASSTLPLLLIPATVGTRLAASTFRIERWLGIPLVAIALLLLVRSSVASLIDRSDIEFYGWRVALEAFPSMIDAHERCGLPFDRYQAGNFAGYGAAILVTGLVGDVVVGIGIATASHRMVAAVVSRWSQKALPTTSDAGRLG